MIDFDSISKKIFESNIPYKELEAFFRTKCRICGHKRIDHNEDEKCEGVMNKPCSSGCDNFSPE